MIFPIFSRRFPVFRSFAKHPEDRVVVSLSSVVVVVVVVVVVKERKKEF